MKPAPASAEWVQQCINYTGKNHVVNCLGNRAEDPYFISTYNNGSRNLYTGNFWDGTDPVELPEGEVVYNLPYTDEQCSDLYTGSYSMSFPVDSVNTDVVDLGSCQLQQTDFEGEGKNIGVCTFSEDGESQNCFSDWQGVSTGQVNEISFDDLGYEDTPATQAEKSDEVPEYLTPTSDPSSCSSGSMSAGGQSYCVDTSSVVVTDLSGSAWTGSSGGGSGGDGDGDGDGEGDGSGDGEGDGEGQCDPETDGECDGEATECLPGMSCYVPTDEQVEAKFFDYFPGSVDNTQVTEYDASDFELDGEYESGLTSGSCPAPVPVTLALGGNSHTFEITFEFFCQFALLIRGLVLASCSFLAANIIYRGVVTLV